jgi:hypothetical protein
MRKSRSREKKENELKHNCVTGYTDRKTLGGGMDGAPFRSAVSRNFMGGTLSR